jgi:hypothetical protein
VADVPINASCYCRLSTRAGTGTGGALASDAAAAAAAAAAGTVSCCSEGTPPTDGKA